MINLWAVKMLSFIAYCERESPPATTLFLTFIHSYINLLVE